MPRLSEVMKQEPVADRKSYRLGDVISMEQIETPELNETGFIEITDEVKSEMKAKGKIGFFEAMGKVDTTELLPFNPERAIKAGALLNSVSKIQNQKHDDKDIKLVSDYIMNSEEERIRGFTFGAHVGRGLSEVPSFMIEFLATGGIAALGKKALVKGAEQGVEIAAKKVAERFVRKSTGMFTMAATRTALMPHRIAEGYADRQVRESLEITDKGVQLLKEATEKPHISVAKAFGDVMIENFSEDTGGVIGSLGKRMLPKGLVSALERIFKRFKPNEAITKLFTKAGFNGILEEMGEERVGNLLRALTGVEDFGADDPKNVMDRIVASFPNGEELLIEGGIFAITGGVVSGVNVSVDQSLKAYKRIKENTKEVPVEKQLNELSDEQIDEILTTEEEANQAINENEEFSEDIPQDVIDELNRADESNTNNIVDPLTESLDEANAEPKDVKTTNSSIDQEIKPKTLGDIRKRLEEIEDIKLRAEFAKETLSELNPVLDVLKRRINSPKKGEFLYEESQRIPKRFKNSNLSGLPLDEVLDEANSSNLGLYFETDGEFIDYLEDLDARIDLLKETITSGAVPLITQRETTILKRRERDIKLGLREGKKIGRNEVNSAKQILDKRRALIKAVKSQFVLTDSELSSINKKDIRLMNAYEFKLFLDNIRRLSAVLAEKREIKERILFEIADKELKKVDNLRAFLSLPSLEKMTVKQLNDFNQALEDTQKGDEFLSVRKLETVKNTELAGIRTLREAKEILAKKLNVPVDQLNNISVSQFDKFTFDMALAEKNAFYALLVDETTKSMLDAEERFHDLEKVIDELVKKARASRDSKLIDKLIPSDERVFNWLEAKAEEKKSLVKEMTDAEIELASFLQSVFAEHRDYLIQHKVLEKYRENYITHIRRGFLETWKEDGILTAFKEVFAQYQEDEAVFNILDDDTQNILPLEKFFQFSMKRTGVIKPSKNVSKAVKTYTKAMYKKQALDKIVPALTIYAEALSPKALTPRGLEMDRRLKKFVNEWINNKKGRKSSLGGFVPQGGKVDLSLKGINAFITLVDLGLNVPVGLASNVGEQTVTYINLGGKKYIQGMKRANTEKGKKIIEANRAFVGKSVWDELTETSDSIGDKFSKGLYSLFRISSINANKIHLLGSLTSEEWAKGEISAERKSALIREIGRYRSIEGSKSIAGSTSIGSTLTKYKTWAIPILTTTLDNLKKVASGKSSFKSRESQELIRASLSSLMAVVMGSLLLEGFDDDDSFIGEVIRKIRRESLTFLQALDIRTFSSVRLMGFIKDLADLLTQLRTLEQYKTKKGYKATKTFQKTFVPRVIRQLLPEESDGKRPRRKLKKRERRER